MLLRSVRIAIDYNRGLALPIRMGHGAWQFIAGVTGPIWAWSGRGRRSRWARPMLVALPIAVLLVPIDGVVSSASRAIPMGGDVQRVLSWLQEYGGLASLVVVAVVIWLLDPANRRRLADLAVAVVASSAAVFAAKILIGRPRPAMADLFGTGSFLGPFGAAPVEGAVRHAWDVFAPGVSNLQSMPSSHTAAAVVLSVFLCRLYPRLKPLAIAMPIVVGVCRVLFGAHYASDVAVGAGMGLAIGQVALIGCWGTRMLGRSDAIPDGSPAQQLPETRA